MHLLDLPFPGTISITLVNCIVKLFTDNHVVLKTLSKFQVGDVLQ